MNRRTRTIAALLLAAAAAGTVYARTCLGGVRMYKVYSTAGPTEYIICTGAGGNCSSGSARQWAANGCDS